MILSVDLMLICVLILYRPGYCTRTVYADEAATLQYSTRTVR